MTSPSPGAPVTRRRLVLHRIQGRLVNDKRVFGAMASLPRAADFVADARDADEVYDLPFTD
jgi:hypothetical protein